VSNSTRLQMNGLAEFRAQLRNLPEDLAQEAGAIVMALAESAQQAVQQAYPEGPTGNLRRGVTVNRADASRFGVRAIVRSRARHSHMFEFGTKTRQTRKGANRGMMPQAPESQRMIPIMQRRRRVMVQALIGVVKKAGFVVSERRHSSPSTRRRTSARWRSRGVSHRWLGKQPSTPLSRS
jgi:hypothetical protein